MIIRPIRPADVPALVKILNAIIAIGGTTAYQQPRTPEYFDHFLRPESPKVFLYVADTSDGLQGMQWVEPLDPPEDDFGGIATFAQPGTTQRGIGKTLFVATHQASLLAGYTGLHAKIRADNAGGLAYYEKMGFRDYGVEKAVPLDDGTEVDRIIKRMAL